MTRDVKTRKATEDDIPFITATWAKSAHKSQKSPTFRDTISALARKELGNTRVAEIDGAIVGYLIYKPRTNVILYAYTPFALRRHGICGTLMRDAGVAFPTIYVFRPPFAPDFSRYVHNPIGGYL